MAKGEAEFLKQRAEKFLANGEDLLNKGIFDLAAFNFEQYCQLILKYYLFLEVGDFPKTHFLKDLLTELGKVYKKENSAKKLLDRDVQVISNLENAYITSRYVPSIFIEGEVREMLGFCKKLTEFLKNL